MIHYRLEGGGRAAPRGWVAALLIVAGVVLLASGLALLLLIAAAAAVVGAGALAFRRLTGRTLTPPGQARRRHALELEPDFEILRDPADEPVSRALPGPNGPGHPPPR